MSRLLRVELTRLRWRRAILLLLAAAVIVPAVILGATAYQTRPISEADRREAEQLAQAEAEQPYVAEELERCLKNPKRYGLRGDRDPQAYCERQVLPRAEWFLYREQLVLGEQRSTTGSAVVVVVGALLLLGGATFAGHDWNTGSMSNQMLFRPRRTQVWSAKALAVLLVGLVVSGVVMAAYWGALIGLAQMRDIDLIDGQVGRIAGQVGRGTVLAAFAGVGGYALTMLSRSTVIALGAMFAGAVVVPILLSVVSFPGSVALQPQNNATAVILDGVDVRNDNEDACFDEVSGRETPNAPGCTTRISTIEGSLYFGGLLLLVAVPSALTFRRRDVP